MRLALLLVVALVFALAATADARTRLPLRTSCIEQGGAILWDPSTGGQHAAVVSGTRFEGWSTIAGARVEQIACALVQPLVFRPTGSYRRFPYRHGFVGCRNHGRPMPLFEVQVEAVAGGHRVSTYAGHSSRPLAWAVTSRNGSSLWFDPRWCDPSR